MAQPQEEPAEQTHHSLEGVYVPSNLEQQRRVIFFQTRWMYHHYQILMLKERKLF